MTDIFWASVYLTSGDFGLDHLQGPYVPWYFVIFENFKSFVISACVYNFQVV